MKKGMFALGETTKLILILIALVLLIFFIYFLRDKITDYVEFISDFLNP